jgi:hypothetical protein
MTCVDYRWLMDIGIGRDEPVRAPNYVKLKREYDTIHSCFSCFSFSKNQSGQFGTYTASLFNLLYAFTANVTRGTYYCSCPESGWLALCTMESGCS